MMACTMEIDECYKRLHDLKITVSAALQPAAESTISIADECACFDSLAAVWSEGNVLSLPAVELSTSMFEEINKIKIQPLLQEESILPASRVLAVVMSLPQKLLLVLSKSVQQLAVLTAEVQEKLLRSCSVIAQSAYVIFLSHRWLEAIDEAEFKKICVEMHQALKMEFLPLVSSLTHYAQVKREEIEAHLVQISSDLLRIGEDMAALIAGTSPLSKYPALRNFGSLSCGVSHPIRLFISLSPKAAGLSPLCKRLCKLLTKELAEALKNYVTAPSNANSQVLRYWKQAMTKFLQAKWASKETKLPLFMSSCIDMLACLQRLKTGKQAFPKEALVLAEESATDLTDQTCQAISTADSGASSTVQSLLQDLQCKIRREIKTADASGASCFALKLMQGSSSLSDGSMTLLAENMRGILCMAADLHSQSLQHKADLSVLCFLTECYIRSSAGRGAGAWTSCERALLLSACDLDARLHDFLCHVWSSLICLEMGSLEEQHVVALISMARHIAKASILTSPDCRMPPVVHQMCALISSICTATPDNLDSLLGEQNPACPDLSCDLGAMVDLIILLKVLHANQNASVQHDLSSKLGELIRGSILPVEDASRLKKIFKAEDAKRSALCAILLMHFIRFQPQPNKEEMFQLGEIILDAIACARDPQQAQVWVEPSLELLSEVLKHSSSMQHKSLLSVLSNLRNLHMAVLDVLASCGALQQMPTDLFHSIFQAGPHFLLEHKSMEALHAFLRRSPHSGLENLVPHSVRKDGTWFKQLLTQYVKAAYSPTTEGIQPAAQVSCLMAKGKAAPGMMDSKLLSLLQDCRKRCSDAAGDDSESAVDAQMARVRRELQSLENMVKRQKGENSHKVIEVLALADHTRAIARLWGTAPSSMV